MIPKAYKENEGIDKSGIFKNVTDSTGKDIDISKISPVKCCNDFVAIVPTSVKTTIVTVNDVSNLGVVVGVGPGLSMDGTRVEPTLKFGDQVLYNPKSASFKINLKDGLRDEKYSDMDFELHFVTERSVYAVL